MSLRKATTAFDETIRVGGIGLALFFMLQYLVFVNTKSLYYLNGGEGTVSLYFSIIGSLAYSTTTIVVMRRPGHKAFKVILPVFDSMLVFCGYNMHLFDAGSDLSSNPMRLLLSVFISLFTGIITFGLGMLNFEERSALAEEGESERITSELQAQVAESNRIRVDLQSKLSESTRINAELNRIAEETRKELRETVAIAEKLLPNHIRYEAWMAKKKSVTNRNGYESAVNQMAETLRGGETVTLHAYRKLVKVNH